MTAWAILPAAILPCGISTIGVSPARAAYAAIEAEVLPVDAQTTALAPSCLATLIAIVMPRSLNEPVGLSPSTLRWTCTAGELGQPRRRDEWRAALTEGDRPRLVGDQVSESRYSSITPCHYGRLVASLVARPRPA